MNMNKYLIEMMEVWREEDEEGKEISRRWYTIRLIDPQNLMVFFFYK